MALWHSAFSEALVQDLNAGIEKYVAFVWIRIDLCGGQDHVEK